MSNYLSVEEYAAFKGITDSAVRKQIRTGKIAALLDKSSKKKKYLIAVSEEEYLMIKNQKVPERGPIPQAEPEPHLFEDAELVSEPTEEPRYNVISMENATFEKLIDNIKTLADDRKTADERTINDLKEELYKTQAELKTFQEENKKQIIEIAQLQTELKIKDIRLTELEKELYSIKSSSSDNDKEFLKLTEELKIASEALADCQNQMQDIVVQKADLQGDLEDERELVKRLEKQNNSAIEEAQEFEQENIELKKQIETLKQKKWWQW